MQVKESSAHNEAYSDEIKVIPGKEYKIYIYFHNNASSSSNESGTAIGTYVKAKISLILKTNSVSNLCVGYIGAANSDPIDVWNTINFINETENDIY